MTVTDIGKKIVEVVRAQRYEDALQFYAENAESVEAQGSPEMPARIKGVEAIRGKAQWWVANNQVHKAEAKGPFPNENRFAVIYNFDVTPKAGPMAGKRMQMEEVGLYTVEGGKIVREEFFYTMG
jgi:SnoaL-like domain